MNDLSVKIGRQEPPEEVKRSWDEFEVVTISNHQRREGIITQVSLENRMRDFGGCEISFQFKGEETPAFFVGQKFRLAPVPTE